MKSHYKTFFSILLSFVFFSSVLFGQFREYDLKIGAKLDYLYPLTDFHTVSSNNIDSYLARIMARYELNYLFETELSLGFGRLSEDSDSKGDDLKTDFNTLDGRLIFRPFDFDDYNPYVFGGVGIISFNVVDFGAVSSWDAKAKEMGFIVPVGVGLEYRLSDNWLLDGNIGWTYSTEDNLDKYYAGSYEDTYLNFGLGITYVFGVNTDQDNDGLENEFERSIGTHFRTADTDGDGLNDGAEVNIHSTNPLSKDTDGDSLEDNEELTVYKTDPTKSDTDGDGLSDSDEIITYKTDPLNSDSDGDKLSDFEEIKTFKTDPFSPDSDGDLLNDFDEVKTYKTNPLNSDSDNDGLTDNVEIHKFKSNPLSADTDGGTKPDGEEAKAGLNLLDPADDVAPIVEVVKEPIIFAPIYFESSSAVISAEYELVLQKSLQILQLNPDIFIEISGHTDSSGSDISNKPLSQKRADNVKEWFVKNGISNTRITSIGKVSEVPAMSNATVEGRSKNRRVVILVIGQK